jgi:ligand-binding SRPBCC domain-containing protein
MDYHHRSVVHAPLAEVVAFHRQATSLATMTPPPLRLTLAQPGEGVADQSELKFTLGLGPFAIRWRAKIVPRWPEGFSDHQLEGPFAAWVHHHSFTALSESKTLIEDRINARLSSHPWKWLVGLMMWLGMPLLFAYRARRVRHLLEPAASHRRSAQSG